MTCSRISDKFRVLAQLNLDGNCYFIMLIGMLFIFMMGSQASWYHILVIAILVLFLSFGAPNQPGSILIGTLIDVPEQIVTDLAKDLCAFFHQESVMVTSSPTSVVFIKETL